jgi:hypothetical protein
VFRAVLKKSRARRAKDLFTLWCKFDKTIAAIRKPVDDLTEDVALQGRRDRLLLHILAKPAIWLRPGTTRNNPAEVGET